jgi:hypothetical protein
MAVLVRPLHSEHSLQNNQYLIQRRLRKTPQSLDEAVLLYNPRLISYNMTIFAMKAAANTKGVWMSASG